MKHAAQRQSLTLPTGTETLHLREAARHRRITREVESVFDLWGYSPAETPLVDFFDVYRPFLSESDARSIYRSVDRQGEILAVRSDTTLFLAKQLGLHLRAEELPVRIQYNDQIVRAEGENDFASNEYQQAGIELVGVTGPEGDLEILLILLETLDRLGLNDGVIHAGSHRVFHAVAAATAIEATELETLMRAVRQRRALTGEFPGITADLEALLRFIGDVSSFTRALDGWTLPAAVDEAARELLEILTLADSLRSPTGANADRLRVDLSEIGSHTYYSGIAFSAYCREGTAAVARGGRYDRLLRQFGCDAPSVGFSMYTRKLPANTLSEETIPAAPAPGPAGTAGLPERLAAIRDAHRRGERMHL